jgi:hypothetical protein
MKSCAMETSSMETSFMEAAMKAAKTWRCAKGTTSYPMSSVRAEVHCGGFVELSESVSRAVHSRSVRADGRVSCRSVWPDSRVYS